MMCIFCVEWSPLRSSLVWSNTLIYPWGFATSSVWLLSQWNQFSSAPYLQRYLLINNISRCYFLLITYWFVSICWFVAVEGLFLVSAILSMSLLLFVVKDEIVYIYFFPKTLDTYSKLLYWSLPEATATEPPLTASGSCCRPTTPGPSQRPSNPWPN